MFEQLPLCVGARVICRRNIDFDRAMVNGTEAIVKDIVWNDNENIVLPMSNRCAFPNFEQVIRTALPKYIGLGKANINLHAWNDSSFVRRIRRWLCVQNDSRRSELQG